MLNNSCQVGRTVLPSASAFVRYAWAVLALNIPVILWGAYVRVSYSGDGCGAHWPFCNGQMLPAQMAKPMLIEFTHRVMTGADTLAVIALCIWAFLAFAKGHVVRRYAVLSLLFLFMEAALGAGLVLFRFVAKDQSAGRVWYLSAHLTNTLLLLGAMTITAWLAHTNTTQVRWRGFPPRLVWALVTTVFVSITGAIAALGDTLFPAASLAGGMHQDFSSGSAMLLRLRLVHPMIAIVGAFYLIWVALPLLEARHAPPVRKAGLRVIVLVLFQLAAGAVNLSLLAPVWMQLIHLFIADIIWIAVVLMLLEKGIGRLISRSAESPNSTIETGKAASPAHFTFHV